jgi:hypothetical protein
LQGYALAAHVAPISASNIAVVRTLCIQLPYQPCQFLDRFKIGSRRRDVGRALSRLRRFALRGLANARYQPIAKSPQHLRPTPRPIAAHFATRRNRDVALRRRTDLRHP